MAKKPIKYPEQGQQVRAAMREIGELWGLERSIRYNELGRALGLGPEEPGQSVRMWAEGIMRISPPAAVAIEMMRLGALPPVGLGPILTKPGVNG